MIALTIIAFEYPPYQELTLLLVRPDYFSIIKNNL